MLYNSQQQGLIIDRCWLIYELVSDKLVPPDAFHIQYPSLVELALTTGYFQLIVEVGRSDTLCISMRNTNLLNISLPWNLNPSLTPSRTQL